MQHGRTSPRQPTSQYYQDVDRPPLPYDWHDTEFAYRKLFPRRAYVVNACDKDAVVRTVSAAAHRIHAEKNLAVQSQG